MFHSGQWGTFKASSFYKNPKVDELLDVAVKSTDRKVREKAYQDAARIVVDEERRVIVGATFVGPGIAESLHAATIAVTAEVPLDRLWHAVPTFPTRSETWLKLLEEYGL